MLDTLYSGSISQQNPPTGTDNNLQNQSVTSIENLDFILTEGFGRRHSQAFLRRFDVPFTIEKQNQM